MQPLLLIAVAGMVGTLARYGLTLWTQQTFGLAFPWGTLVVNSLGSFLFGLVWALADQRRLISPEARLARLTDFMGAFTTFSTLMFDTGAFLSNSQWLLAAANLVG